MASALVIPIPTYVRPAIQPRPARNRNWKDGRKFARRVQVMEGSLIKYLFAVPGDEALRMCSVGAAEPIPSQDHSDINRIVLLRIPNEKLKLGVPRPLTPNSYGGKRYVFKERLSPQNYNGLNCFALEKLNKDDLWAYKAAQLDCLV
jgi:hypothetical protein